MVNVMGAEQRAVDGDGTVRTDEVAEVCVHAISKTTNSAHESARKRAREEGHEKNRSPPSARPGPSPPLTTRIPAKSPVHATFAAPEIQTNSPIGAAANLQQSTPLSRLSLSPHGFSILMFIAFCEANVEAWRRLMLIA